MRRAVSDSRCLSFPFWASLCLSFWSSLTAHLPKIQQKFDFKPIAHRKKIVLFVAKKKIVLFVAKRKHPTEMKKVNKHKKNEKMKPINLFLKAFKNSNFGEKNILR